MVGNFNFINLILTINSCPSIIPKKKNLMDPPVAPPEPSVIPDNLNLENLLKESKAQGPKGILSLNHHQNTISNSTSEKSIGFKMT